MRLSKLIALIFVLLLFFGFSFFLWIYTSESGLNWAWQQSQSYIPKALKIKKLSGSLNSKVSASQVQWHSEDLTLQLDKAIIQCDLSALFFSKLNCPLVSVNEFNIITTKTPLPPSEEETTSSALPDLPDISLPLKIQVAKLSVNNLVIKEKVNQSETESVRIKAIKIADFTANKESFSVKQLALNFQENQLKLSGQLKTKKNWPHNLVASLSSPEVNIQLTTQGEAKRSATLNVNAQTPFDLTLKGQWFWKQGIYLREGTLSAKPQEIALGAEKIQLKQFNGLVNLNWPKLELTNTLKLSYLSSPILTTTSAIHIEDLLHWNRSALATLESQGILEQSFLKKVNDKFLQAEFFESIDKSTSLPVNLNAKININNDIVTVNNALFNIAELQAQTNLQTKLSHLIDELVIESQLTTKAPLQFAGMSLKKLASQWRLKTEKEKFQLTSNGKFSELQLQEQTIENVNWNVQLAKLLDVKITAKKISIADKTLNDFSATIKGTPEKHKLSLQVTPQNFAPLDISLHGSYTSMNNSGQAKTVQDDKAWFVNNLLAKSSINQAPISITGEELIIGKQKQTASEICLKHKGQLCINAKYTNQFWLAELDIEAFDLHPFNQITQQLGVALPINITGLLEGYLNVEGQNNQIEKMKANIQSNELVIHREDLFATINNLSIKTNSQNKIHSLTVSWQSFDSYLQTGNFYSSIIGKDGTTTLIADSLDDIKITTQQNAINWNLPGSQSEQSFDNAESSLDQEGSTEITENSEAEEALEKLKKNILTIPELHLSSQLKNNQFSNRLSIQLLEEDKVESDFSIALPIEETSKVSGNVSLSINQLSWLKQWYSDIDLLQGYWKQELTIKGNLNKPLITGEGELFVEKLSIQELGLDINDSKLHIVGDNNQVNVDGLLKNKNGELKVEGNAKLTPKISAHLSVEGEKIILLDSVDNKIVASPNIQAEYQENKLDVSGKILINEAKVKITALPKQAISVSEDQRIVGNKSAEQNEFNYNISLILETGDKVHIDGFGLTSRVSGEVKAELASQKPTRVNGQLHLIDGKFEAYKQILTIEEGQLLFLGQPENPGIQFKATRHIEDIEVGVIANGSANNPRLTLFSQPSMSDQDTLSLLLTGRKLESINDGKQTNALANAAINLGIEGANKIAQKIGSTLGIKDLSLSSKTKEDSTRVELGAQINEKLNVGYGTTIDSANELQAGWVIKYQLTPSFAFEAISGEEKSANITYRKTFSSDDEETAISNKEKKQQD